MHQSLHLLHVPSLDSFQYVPVLESSVCWLISFCVISPKIKIIKLADQILGKEILLQLYAFLLSLRRFYGNC